MESYTDGLEWANIKFRVPYSQQRYSFKAVSELTITLSKFPSNPNRNSKGNPNHTNFNTRYRCEYSTLNSMFAYNVCVLLICLVMGRGPNRTATHPTTNLLTLTLTSIWWRSDMVVLPGRYKPCTSLTGQAPAA